MYKLFFLHHWTCQTITFGYRGASSCLESLFTCDFWNSQNQLPNHSSSQRQLPGDQRSLRPCQRSPRLDAGEIPLASGHGGALCRGDRHLQSLFASVNSLQRPTQGPLRLFIWTFKGCYITRLNEVFNGHDSGGLLCSTGATLRSWFVRN